MAVLWCAPGFCRRHPAGHSKDTETKYAGIAIQSDLNFNEIITALHGVCKIPVVILPPCLYGCGVVITDAQSALDLLMSAKYDVGTKNIVIGKELIVDDFFILSRGLAGKILQKYVNYGGRIAIYGDYTHYTSKQLKDFIYESNKGKDVFFFIATEYKAIEALTR